MDFTPPPATYPQTGILSAYGAGSYAASVQRGNAGSASSVAWPTIKEVLYIPVTVMEVVTIVTFAWANGSTVASTNHIEGGIYDELGNKIAFTNCVSQGTASIVQTVALTAAGGASLTLSPGIYFLALTCDTTVATFQGFAGATALSRISGVQVQTLAATYTVASDVLPATATFAACDTGRLYLATISYEGGTF